MTHSATGSQSRVQASSRAMLLECLGLVGELCLSAATAEQAFYLACKFSPLWSSWPYTLQRERELVLLRSDAESAQRRMPVAEALARTWLWTELAACVAGIPVQPQAAHFACVPFESRADLREALECTVHFDRSALGFDFRVADLQHENRLADARRLQRLTFDVADRLANMSEPLTTTDRVWRALSYRQVLVRFRMLHCAG